MSTHCKRLIERICFRCLYIIHSVLQSLCSHDNQRTRAVLLRYRSVFFLFLSFSWTRNGTHFDIDEDPNVTMKPHSGTLVVDISRAKAEQYECVYQCTARNKHGTAVSNNIVVRQSSKCGAVYHFIFFHFLNVIFLTSFFFFLFEQLVAFSVLRALLEGKGCMEEAACFTLQ